jgi:hypothetical protein
MAFLTLDGSVLIDTSIAEVTQEEGLVEVRRLSDEKGIYGRKIIVKGNL